MSKSNIRIKVCAVEEMIWEPPEAPIAAIATPFLSIIIEGTEDDNGLFS
jgi:hypothetical protein